MSHEFELIAKHFAPLGSIGEPSRFLVGQGDDCAVVHPDPRPMAFTIDTQVSGRHFFDNDSPENIASRGFNAALSDLAAMAATPAFFTLALSLPDTCDDAWLTIYAQTLSKLAQAWQIPLIGGDTTASPTLVQTFQMHGYLDQAPLTRSGAQIDDWVIVTGTLGDAAAALSLITQGNQPPPSLYQAFYSPEPQIQIAKAIAPWATACIDISDGLLADLGHICARSGCGAVVFANDVPLSVDFIATIDAAQQLPLALSGGDDYQLCFTLPPQHWEKVSQLPVSRIGKITNTSGVQAFDAQGRAISLAKSGYQHR